MAVGNIGAPGDMIVQSFTPGNYTLSNPFSSEPGALAIVTLIGPGGGGASGGAVIGNSNGSTLQGAGGGGGGGARLRMALPAAFLSGLALAVGAGGTTGTAAIRTTAGFSSGNAGGQGAGTYLSVPFGLIGAGPGIPGSWQNASNSAATGIGGAVVLAVGGLGGVLASQSGGVGGAGGFVNTGTTTLNAPQSGFAAGALTGAGVTGVALLGCAGGGGGGPCQPASTGTALDAALGGSNYLGAPNLAGTQLITSTAAGANVATGGFVAAGNCGTYGGAGGSGGGPCVRGISRIAPSTDSVTGGAGGAGQYPGGGGGGGGAAAAGAVSTTGTETVTSGVGGAGADGLAVIVWLRAAPANLA